ncbi:general odorant-binding protein 72 [Anopheles ziemanni]|uniref:general odorant-binding protein 72 n=1 Tax=Anopheles coustani TaxID=139045 RepID=UPI002657FD66|nr:general odorant-binding protein 72 [Anopheles coustani]XP_058169671.1 general odorant-binding protein 72 [Anopheles ziemanni]
MVFIGKVVPIVCCAVWLIFMQQQAFGIDQVQLEKTARTFRKVCQPKHKISDDVADDVNRGIFAETKEFKCYISCLLEIMQVVRKGKVNYEKSLRQIDTMLPEHMKPSFRAGLEACKSVAQGVKDHCEAATILLQCFYKNNPMFIFP